MTARTVYWHVGMPKCATTSIQSMMDNARERGALAAYGVSYPRARRDDSRGQGNASTLFRALFNSDWPTAQRILDAFLAGENSVVLSSEMMIALGRKKSMAEILEAVERKGYRNRLICFMRRQDIWVESDFKQHMRGGSEWVPSLGDLVARRISKRTLDYDWVLGNWERLIDAENIDIVPLRERQPSDAAPNRFAELIGCPDLFRGADVSRPENVSPPAGLVAPARHLRLALFRQGLRPDDVTAALDIFFDRAPQIAPVPPRKFLLPLAERHRILSIYAASNARLADRLNGGAALFDEMLATDPASEAPLEAEATDYLAQYLVGTQDLAGALGVKATTLTHRVKRRLKRSLLP